MSWIVQVLLSLMFFPLNKLGGWEMEQSVSLIHKRLIHKFQLPILRESRKWQKVDRDLIKISLLPSIMLSKKCSRWLGSKFRIPYVTCWEKLAITCKQEQKDECTLFQCHTEIVLNRPAQGLLDFLKQSTIAWLFSLKYKLKAQVLWTYMLSYRPVSNT